MPLIQITTKPHLYPPDTPGTGTVLQERTAEFGEALPPLFVGNIGELRMEVDTPEKGVQVTHELFSGRGVNIPDMWVLIEFSEDCLSESEQIEVTGKVKELLLGWFRRKSYILPENYACDVRWSPSHGFLRIDNESLDW